MPEQCGHDEQFDPGCPPCDREQRAYCDHGHKPACDLCVARRALTRTRRKLSELRRDVRSEAAWLRVDHSPTALRGMVDQSAEALLRAADRSEVRRKKGGRHG